MSDNWFRETLYEMDYDNIKTDKNNKIRQIYLNLQTN